MAVEVVVLENIKHAQRAHAQAFRMVLAIIQRVTGLRPDPALALQAIAEELVQTVSPSGAHRQRINLSLPEVLALLAEYRHQALIDRVATWGTRTFGPNSKYRDCYPEYVREARVLGIRPLSLKSFQNRAYRDPVELKAEASEAAARHRRRHAA